MATGRTTEGTIWTTRPMSPEIEVSYKCEHHGGTLPCTLGDKPEFHYQTPTSWLGGEGSKPYSPATPKGDVRPILPANVGDAFYATLRDPVIRRRLDGLEPWPAVKPDKAPKLAELSRRLADPAVVAGGGRLAMPLGTRPAPTPEARLAVRASKHHGRAGFLVCGRDAHQRPAERIRGKLARGEATTAVDFAA